MALITQPTQLALWQDLVRQAESSCSIALQDELEYYLILLLTKYMNKPELAKQVFASKFLESLHLSHAERQIHLQNVGDECLLFAGLFPRVAEKKRVKLSYFVDLGRAAYLTMESADQLFNLLAQEFVILMDVLQSLRQHSNEYPDLLPLEAYEQWSMLGSQRALRIMKQYTVHKEPFVIKIKE